jgi:hypothetical protein
MTEAAGTTFCAGELTGDWLRADIPMLMQFDYCGPKIAMGNIAMGR